MNNKRKKKKLNGNKRINNIKSAKYDIYMIKNACSNDQQKVP